MYFEAAKGHTGWLMPQLDSTLKSLGLSPSRIDLVAAGVGPGTFTGVKVGVACAKAVAMGLGVPMVGMPTLDLLAAGAPDSADLVLATIDARRGQVYAAAYRQDAGRRKRVTDYLCVTPDELARVVAPLGLEGLALVGEEPPALVAWLGGSGRVRVVEGSHPGGGAMLALASELAARGGASDPASVMPIYLKKPT
jgi:tRNA threonylcarbamoyladenosine biosynthesis protein TsaB